MNFLIEERIGASLFNDNPIPNALVSYSFKKKEFWEKLDQIAKILPNKSVQILSIAMFKI